MNIHTSDWHQIPSQNKTKSKFLEILKNSNFKIVQDTLHATHLLKFPDKMKKYETDPARTVGAAVRTPDAGRTDRRIDGQTEWNQYTPNNLINICRSSFTHTLNKVVDKIWPTQHFPTSWQPLANQMDFYTASWQWALTNGKQRLSLSLLSNPTLPG